MPTCTVAACRCRLPDIAVCPIMYNSRTDGLHPPHGNSVCWSAPLYHLR
ncbi:hypothetical protein PVAP13_9KG331700 [Panicum virgatum]|uniref:Uncharacterized protein n=1 Tax=Panicum virgatum TaxID=38727 RepID=A0A8T0NME1_PANVG|nr:hypothetical protein PVAP13_9KG331700 [Panicum virgatum]